MSAAKSTANTCEWVTLKHPETQDVEDTASAFCSFIEKFLWREHKGDREFLIVINNRNGPRNRYKYKGVPEELFAEAWDRAYNPEEYENNFGSWFTHNIKDDYQTERFD